MTLKMDKRALLVHGGGGQEDYEADAKLVATSWRDSIQKSTLLPSIRVN